MQKPRHQGLSSSWLLRPSCILAVEFGEISLYVCMKFLSFWLQGGSSWFPFCFHLVFLYIFKVLFSPSLPQISLSLGISTYLTPLFQEKGLYAKHMLFRGCSLVGDCLFFQIHYSLIMGICLKSTVIKELAFISTQINISPFFHLCVYRTILNSLTFRSLQF